MSPPWKASQPSSAFAAADSLTKAAHSLSSVLACACGAGAGEDACAGLATESAGLGEAAAALLGCGCAAPYQFNVYLNV